MQPFIPEIVDVLHPVTWFKRAPHFHSAIISCSRFRQSYVGVRWQVVVDAIGELMQMAALPAECCLDEVV